MQKPSFFKSLARSQIASVIATISDFSMLIFLAEVVGIYYVWATACGAFTGAVIHFLLGRFWAFIAIEGNFFHQAAKYGLVAVGSLILNSSGVYAFTQYGGLPYPVSKVITAIIIGLTYNFLLHRYFVFRR